ncbi:lysosomal protective protein-like [Tubulanus polymorphus]|uniref:lysosomal protective protein-like n=1 Tax=Tubulanus polymorphus TaxID=672921 RepID=UPI003DA5FF58
MIARWLSKVVLLVLVKRLNECKMLQIHIFAIFLVILLPTIIYCAVENDRVTYLPGLKPPPKFRHYSGYLKASGGRLLHYWFMEASKDSAKAPVVLWLNGGPGCSSLGGLLTEHGPFLINKDGKHLNYNPYSWNLVSNMLYLEAPAGVGFSYSPYKNYTTDDDETSLNNYHALVDFFDKYPEFRKNEFYITGESYGGIYVPTLANRVMENRDINLKGIAVGNGLSSTKSNDNSIIYFGYFHGLFSKDLWQNLTTVCCKTTDDCNFHDNPDLTCQSKVQEAVGLIYRSGINMYNLYASCAVEGNFGGLKKTNDGKVVYHDPGFLFSRNKFLVQERQKIYRYGNNVRMDPPCVNFTSITNYLNSNLVRKELHIPSSVQQWTVCSSVVNMNYRRIYNSMKQQYLRLLATKKYRVLVYNGDVDMACNFLGDQWFTDDLNQKEIRPRKAWHYFDPKSETLQIAGFVRQFEDLTVLTVKGAGHMVPGDKPNPAFVMFNKFLQGSAF